MRNLLSENELRARQEAANKVAAEKVGVDELDAQTHCAQLAPRGMTISHKSVNIVYDNV